MSNKAETILQNKIRVRLSELGCIVLRHDVGVFSAPNGSIVRVGTIGEPDLTVIGPNGIVAWIEIKIAPNKPTKEQIAFMKRLQELGHKCGVAYSVEDAISICGLK